MDKCEHCLTNAVPYGQGSSTSYGRSNQKTTIRDWSVIHRILPPKLTGKVMMMDVQCSIVSNQILSFAAYVPTKQCPKPSGIFPNRFNCTTFYQCTDGVHHLQECPGGLHYDRKRVRCNFPKKAKCKEAKIKNKPKPPKPKEPGKPQPKKQSKHCPKMDGIFSNPANCSTFYFCVDGRAYLQECPLRLVFDEQNMKCDHPKVVGCTPPSGTLSILHCPEPDGIFRHPVNCNTFYLCKQSRIYEYECPIGLIFNYDEKRCDYKRNFQCPAFAVLQRCAKVFSILGFFSSKAHVCGLTGESLRFSHCCRSYKKPVLLSVETLNPAGLLNPLYCSKTTDVLYLDTLPSGGCAQMAFSLGGRGIQSLQSLGYIYRVRPEY
ncbi:protein obstructor-E [Caerostris darwini]|uniref:Protein obstructor-E n=1 Tax=Caerostris darwini TaxID=1538125 RepID=A0AAV4SB18_9ARAC|nr:protein obstructor-E [Caerostris darwini]